MRAWLARTGAALLAEPPGVTEGLLAATQQTRGYGGSAEQQGAWEVQIAALRDALRAAGAKPGPWRWNTTCCGRKSAPTPCC